jgi:hypothetical protein
MTKQPWNKPYPWALPPLEEPEVVRARSNRNKFRNEMKRESGLADLKLRRFDLPSRETQST